MATFGTDIPGMKRFFNDNIKGPRTPENMNSVLSSYMNYGSYSGADIKVVVHYPNTERTDALEEAEYLKSQILEEINSLNNSTNTTPQEQVEWDQAMTTATTALADLDEELKGLRGLATSKVLAEIQSISWSTHRDKYPVRTFGAVYPRGFARGGRTIAGTMVLTTFYEHALHELLDLNIGVINTGTSDRDLFTYTTNLPDQVPPVDISIVAANEYGAISHMGIYGLEFVQTGGTFSIEDIFTESIVQYVARDIDPMRLAGLRKINGKGVQEEWITTARGLSVQKSQENAHLTRRNPFI